MTGFFLLGSLTFVLKGCLESSDLDLSGPFFPWGKLPFGLLLPLTYFNLWSSLNLLSLLLNLPCASSLVIDAAYASLVSVYRDSLLTSFSEVGFCPTVTPTHIFVPRKTHRYSP